MQYANYDPELERRQQQQQQQQNRQASALAAEDAASSSVLAPALQQDQQAAAASQQQEEAAALALQQDQQQQKQQSEQAAAGAGKRILEESLQKQIKQIQNTNTDINKVFKALSSASPATPEAVNKFKANVDAAKTELDTANAKLAEYKKNTNKPQFPMGPLPGGEALGGGSSKSKSKKKRKSYKSYHPEIGKTRKHHSHDDHKRVSFVHQA